MSEPPLNTIASVLKTARKQLQASSDSSALDAELLLAHCLDKNQTYLHTWPEKPLNDQQLSCFSKLIDKRKTDYPVAYILGSKAFWTLDLIVTPDVLIPRPETELLVEVALEKINTISKPKILDLGTGSGAIALALAKEREDAQVFATDFSKKALEVAQLNAKHHDLLEKVTFIESNWYSNIKEKNFDLIVSNPPYIDVNDPHLLKTIRHEPQQALVADNKGFGDIEIIIQKSKSHLKKDGFLMLEHGYDQADKTLEIFNDYGFYQPENRKDLNHHPRISYAQKN